MLYVKKLLFPATCGLVLGSAVVQGAQVVTPAEAEQTVSQGTTPVTVEVQYDVTGPQSGAETGLGLRMHFNSSALTLDEIPLTTALKNSVVVGGVEMQDLQPIGAVEDDTEDYDNDPDTDKRVIIGWVDARATDELDDPNVRWPSGQALPATLFSANFTASGTFAGWTTVNFTASSTSAAAGSPADFVGNPATICIDGPGGQDCLIDEVILGDANDDKSVNVGDLVTIVNLITSGATEWNPGADCNEDGSINVGDLVCTVNIIAPPA